MMYSTISVNTAESAWNNALDAWQDWSDATFDDQYREAILTLVAGLAKFVGYLAGFTCSWLLLQCLKIACYWLIESAQAVPVLNGWWRAPFVEIEAVQYPDYCWQVMARPSKGTAPAVSSAILDYELAWACAAEPLG
jgi:hypothetical protein